MRCKKAQAPPDVAGSIPAAAAVFAPTQRGRNTERERETEMNRQTEKERHRNTCHSNTFLSCTSPRLAQILLYMTT